MSVKKADKPAKDQQNPQFTESIAMIMEQFKDRSNKQDRSTKIKQWAKRLGLLVILLAIITSLLLLANQIDSISLSHTGDQTQLLIRYKP